MAVRAAEVSCNTQGVGLDVEIRAASESDAADLQRFAAWLFSERLPGVYSRPVPTVEEEVAFIRSRIEPANSTLMIARNVSGIVGLIDFVGGSLAEEAHSGSMGLSVDSDHRGRGIGTSLIEALLDWAPSAGITRIEVRAWSNNPGALRLYERMGFAREGLLSGAIVMDGQEADVIVLAQRVQA